MKAFGLLCALLLLACGVEENFVYGVGHIVKFTDGKVSEIVEAR